ncbi:hypothetical protein L249_0646 [Ophiocordyceps polyrhachis-furcata BCC 54312]|uniref:AB hydrolase-1 domain-containing protein n=1 Tax=Ophiocordyceps polyrhachis-furcata BCC 54312 TaxID=1330021 RepID=A0A367LD82_9HYPO|nr:hypothetical protein L249_0646 [Ophiocordyceps polyrhachis-furcata BCC 54312]
MKLTLVLALVTVAQAAAADCSTSDSKTAGIRWGPCPDKYDAKFECGKLQVPIDYDDKRSGQFDISMLRLPCVDNGTCQGNLFFNFGGPGDSAMETINDDLEGVASEKLRKAFTLIGPDLRGIGNSHPVRCDVELLNRRVSLNVTGERELEQLAAHNKQLGESCANLTGSLFYHVDTISAARDLDQIRQVALGDEKFNYYGVSYGTQLGSQYASLFPDRVGRMVLDGNLIHSDMPANFIMGEAATFENSFNRLTEWCKNSTECALHGEDVAAIFDRLVDQSSIEPLAAPGCEKSKECWADVTAEDLLGAVQDLLGGGRKKWPEIAQGIKEARDGNATSLSSSLKDEFGGGNTAVTCLDGFGIDLESAKRMAAPRLLAARSLTPRSRGFNGISSAQLDCMGWPAPVTNPMERLKVEASVPPILLVNALHDPSTSVMWAVQLREQIPSAINVFRDGDGHGSYEGGETQDVMDAFLLGEKMPEDMLILRT